MFDFQFIKKIYRSTRWSFWILGLGIVIALFGHIIAAERSSSFVPPLIPYAYSTLDNRNMGFISPFEQQDVPSIYYRHWLGTDNLGRDVVAGLINGTRIALAVGIAGMGIALLIGLFFGLIAGYFGNERFRLSLGGFILRGGISVAFIFYTFIFFQQKENIFILFFICICVHFLIVWGKQFSFPIHSLNQSINIPLDTLIMRIVEVMESIPNILWLLGVVAATGKLSIERLVIFIGLVSWTSLARLIRGEVLRVRPLEYVEAAHSMGFSEIRVICRHILPNILTPILITVSFGIANTILLESFLTFSGLGLPIELVTWGSMLTAAKDDLSAWWMVVFPGLAIFITVTVFNRIGDVLSQK